jgi:predicted ATPase/Tfp pilus assembly protein PilF/predicted Ser/Thr protein kinase
MDLTGKTLGQYEIVEQIGRGGTAFVYKAYQSNLERYLALKVLLPQQAQTANFGERFEREARIVARLNHPNILPIIDFGQAEGLSYIAMKYVAGGSLKKRLKEKSFDLAKTARLIAQIASALDHAHQRNILHRDIKPSNVLLDEEDWVQLTDFGLTKILAEDEEELTGSGIGVGTPTYISPEQGQGLLVDHHTDIYALGIILYQMLTGKVPFRTKNPMATIFKHIHSPPPSPCKINPALPKTVETVIFKALAKAPADRYHSAGELAQAFLEAVSESKTGITVKQVTATVTTNEQAGQASGSAQGPAAPLDPEPAADAGDALCHNLPLSSTPFIGRTQELAEIVTHLANFDCRILSLVGPGGMGKTRLAIQAARQLAAATPANTDSGFSNKVFPHGIYFVSLSPINSADQLIPAIAASLEFTFYGDKAEAKDPKAQLLNYLREKNMLLILDNFEHLLPETGLLTEILKYAPGIKILVTSRERLNLRGEWLLEVVGLSYPDYETVTGLENYGAVQLFLQNARRLNIGYTLPQEEIPHLIRICQLLEGMPLGLELASSWMRLLTCREIAGEIEENIDFLATSLRDIPERHQSLRAVFEYSWNRLSDVERIIFRKLAIFRGGFCREAAEQIAGASLANLSTLMDKSFLRRTPTGYYQIHEVLRQFAAEKLYDVPEELEQTQERHGQYYAEFLQRREKHLQEQRQRKALQEIGEEIENVQAAWNWMIEQGRTIEIGQALGSLYHFYSIRSWLQEGIETFDRAARRVREVEGMMHDFHEETGTIYSRILARQGRFYYRLRNYGKAREQLQKSLTISEYLQAHAETAFSLNSLGNIAYRLGEMEPAKKLYEDSLAIYQSIEDRWGIAMSMSNLGVVIHDLGGQAQHLFEASLEIFKSLGDLWGIARSYNYLGIVAYSLGDYDEARGLYEESLTICREIGDQYGIARSLTNLGNVAYSQGDYPRARKLHQEGLDIFSDIGDRWNRATSLANLGDIARALGEYDEAEDLFERSLSICQELDNQRGAAFALNQLGRIAHVAGVYEEARRFYTQSLTICRKIEHHWGTVTALNDLGHLACSLKDYPTARQYFNQALQEATEIKAFPQILKILVGVATLMAEAGENAEAVALLAILQPHLLDHKEAATQAKPLMDKLEGELSPDAFIAAWERGQTQTLDAVVTTILMGEPSPA